METKNQNKIVTAPSLEKTQELYEIYRQRYGADKTPEDFYRFMTTPGVERRSFLLENTQARPLSINNTIIHKCV